MFAFVSPYCIIKYTIQDRKLLPGDKEETAPDVNQIKQRLKELYDFKTETEWPKRIRSSSRATPWISKSSSEDDKSLQSQSQPQKQAEPVRRNSQDLEFNDRTSNKSNNNQSSQSTPTHRQLPERASLRKDSSTDQVFESLDDVNKRRLRQFQEQLRFSEDLSKTDDDKVGEVTFAKVTRVRDRRTYSDDYENPSRRKYSASMIAGQNVLKQNKRNSDTTIRTSRPSYAEPEPTSSILRNSRIASDASYASIDSSSMHNPYITKRGSVEFKTNTRKIEVSHRRTMSQYEPRPRTILSQYDTRARSSGQFESKLRTNSFYEARPKMASHYEPRPRTPVPPPEIEDLYRDFRSPGKSGGSFSRQRRNSTRYKVYLT